MIFVSAGVGADWRDQAWRDPALISEVTEQILISFISFCESKRVANNSTMAPFSGVN
jgi:hypothetical protein